MKTVCRFTLALLLIVFFYSDSSSAADLANIEVSPKGDIQTLQLAKIKVQEIKANNPEAEGIIRVTLRKGVYHLHEPLLLGPEDGGSERIQVVYEGHPGEKAIISGGLVISGWEETKKDGRRLWVAELPDDFRAKVFREFYVNGDRAEQARLPEEGLYYFTEVIDVSGEDKWSNGSLGAKFVEGDIRDFKNLNDVEIVAYTRWIESRQRIESVDLDSNTVTFDRRSTFRLEDTRKRDRFGRYYLENVWEGLDQPGEWYHDFQKGKIYYLPRVGEKISDSVLEIPCVEQLVRVIGSENEPVRNLTFNNLVFERAEWTYPEGDAGSVQAAFETPGAVYFENALESGLEHCVVREVGDYGVEIGKGCSDCFVKASAVQDLGAGGIKLGHGSTKSTVADCTIERGSRIYASGVGVWVGNSGHNAVIHNEVRDFFYTGISVGWSWGYGPSDAVDNNISFNHIHEIGQGLISDMGGIYTLGIAEGTQLSHNLIHDVSSYSYGGWGIYPDEGSTHILVEDNVVYRTKTGGFHQHYGKENTIRNNIFAFAVEQQLQRSREEDHKSFDFVNNIVYFDQGTLLGSTWKNDQWFMDKNVYWNPDPSKIDFKGQSLEEWRKRGHDKNSIVVDPLFVDIERDDYRLKPDSPAIEIGFNPIDLSQVGPRVRSGLY
ncbi:MAG: right-handed parallel beta-helix repeat-containing protein [Candidatus Omnitrophica bacterium]|nr:right-handed parallel beta-helix repeat-containing protein [Candidatus Omnitrophota bacterium]